MKIRHTLSYKKHFRFSVKPYLFMFVLLSSIFTQSKAQVYDYTALQGAGDYSPYAQFRIYVPDTISVIRGVYYYADGIGFAGPGGDSRSIRLRQSPAWRPRRARPSAREPWFETA